MPLEEIRLIPKNITRGLDTLRDMKRLKTIGNTWDQAWPAAKFWERYDKGSLSKRMRGCTTASLACPARRATACHRSTGVTTSGP
jgi:hypothetical protein